MMENQMVKVIIQPYDLKTTIEMDNEKTVLTQETPMGKHSIIVKTDELERQLNRLYVANLKEGKDVL